MGKTIGEKSRSPSCVRSASNAALLEQILARGHWPDRPCGRTIQGLMRSHYYVEFPDVHGKTIRRFRFTNDIDYRCVSIDFEDDSVLAFKLELGIDEEVELGVMRNGNLEDIRPLKPVPVRRSI